MKKKQKSDIALRDLKQPEKKVHCPSCDSHISARAKICSQCGADQRPLWSNIKKVTAIASMISIVMGVITIAIGVYPDARDALNYEESVDIFSYRSQEPHRAQFAAQGAVTTFVNTGTVDVFINEVVFQPEPTRKAKISLRYAVNQWVKRGEALTVPTKKLPTYFKGNGWCMISAEQFDALKATETNDNLIRCRLYVADPEFGIVRPEFKATEVPVDVSATIYFSTRHSKKLKTIKSSRVFHGFFQHLRDSSTK